MPTPIFEPTPDAPDSFQPTAPPALVPNLAEPDHYRLEAPVELVSQAREFIVGAHWVWAKTYAKFAPHWYTLCRQARPVAGYDALRTLIYEYNHPRIWRNRAFRGITLSGLHLWIMPDDPGTRNGGTILVNAKPAEPGDWANEQPRLI